MTEFYHVTDEKHLPDILRNGLKPRTGTNARLSEEPKPYVYLCGKQDIPYWEILLGKHVIVSVSDLNPDTLQKYPYRRCNEYLYNQDIPPEQITVIPAPEPTTAHMRRLCKDYLEELHATTRDCAVAYNLPDSREPLTWLAHYLPILLSVLHKLNFSCLSPERTASLIKAYADDGEYAITDAYKDTGRRLWEQLIYYPEDKLAPLRQSLHNFIRTTFPDSILYLNTGGWTNP